jgi:hypothetical protein
VLVLIVAVTMIRMPLGAARTEIIAVIRYVAIMSLAATTIARNVVRSKKLGKTLRQRRFLRSQQIESVVRVLLMSCELEIG